MKELFKKRGFKYILIFVIFTLLLTSMMAKPVLTLFLGQEIQIKVKAYDPRDIFRGDYIQLAFEIDEISVDKLDSDIRQLSESNLEKNLYNKELYVLVTQQGTYYEVDKVTLKTPKEGLYLKTKFLYAQRHENNEVTGIIVEYPLDKYFVPENTGKELEEKVQKGEAYATIKVFKGYAVLEEILMEK